MEPVWWTKCSFLILSMIILDQDIGRTLSGKLSGSDGEHIGPTTETIGDKQDVGVASRRDRKGIEVVDTDGDTRTFRERHGDDWPTDSQPRCFARLAHQTVAKPPSGTNIHADPPIKPLQHRKVRVVPRWQETVEWQACMIQGRMRRGT